MNCVIQVRSRGQKKHKSWGEGKKKRSDGMLRLCWAYGQHNLELDAKHSLFFRDIFRPHKALFQYLTWANRASWPWFVTDLSWEGKPNKNPSKLLERQLRLQPPAPFTPRYLNPAKKNLQEIPVGGCQRNGKEELQNLISGGGCAEHKSVWEAAPRQLSAAGAVRGAPSQSQRRNEEKRQQCHASSALHTLTPHDLHEQRQGRGG